jgi:hypothetical protein
MKPTKIALVGALAAFAILSLSACATPQAPRTRLIEVPTPVLQRVPDERTAPLRIPHEYPDQILGGDVEARLLQCEQIVDLANADREWIRNRQRSTNNKGDQ